MKMVVHLEDLMFRRTRIALLLSQGGKEYLPRIRNICQPELGWDDEKWLRKKRTTWKHGVVFTAFKVKWKKQGTF